VADAKAEEFQGKPHSSKSTQDAETGISQSDPYLAAPNQEDAFVTERRKGRESTEKAGKQKQAGIGREHIAMLYNGGERTYDKATNHVDGKGTEWKSPRGGVMQNDSAQLVTTNRTNKPAKADN
jgi:hypothetical protein